MAEPIPLNFPPGLFETSTKAGMAGKWHDGHLIRWVEGRLRPVLGWERIGFHGGATIASPIRALHYWVDNIGVERVGVLCEQHLYVYAGGQLIDITPVDGIKTPGVTTLGGFGADLYDTGVYDSPRAVRTDRLRIGHVWKLANWGEDLLAMASPDGRLLRWKPSLPSAKASAVPNAPTPSRTFVVTPERHVMLFGMYLPPPYQNTYARFGWCSQENIEDWNFSSTTNTAGYYDIQPASRILAAEAVRGAIIFWTVQGAFVVSYRGLPYIYTYDHLGAYLGPLSGDAAATYPGGVIWPAADGFWQFDGNAIRQVSCSVLDWFQQTYDAVMTRENMTGFFNGHASELWWSFPSQRYVLDPITGERTETPGAANPTNDLTIMYNFEEGWWSKAQLGRTAGCPGTMVNFPVMGNGLNLYRHEKGNLYSAEDIRLDPHQDPPNPDRRNLPWVRSGAVNVATGKQMATTKQIWIDTDAPLGAVGYELFAIKGRFSQEPRSKGLKIPRVPGKVDYRITGRDFFLKLQSLKDGVTWTHGQSHLLMSPRGRNAFDDKAGAQRAPAGAP